MTTIERMLGAAGARARRHSCCAATAPATSAGWSTARRALCAGIWLGHHFEALVAEIAAQFIRSYDPAREHCWIAEIDGEPVGSIFLVKASDDVAKLRLLLVEQEARGLGLGPRAGRTMHPLRARGRLHTITLWTQSILVAARKIYQHAGFRLRQGREAPQLRRRSRRRDLGDEAVAPPRHSGAARSGEPEMTDYADAPFAFGRRRCSSSRGMISTKLQGRVR